jgi:sugar/nucleoside kinase (ribokinase family)
VVLISGIAVVDVIASGLPRVAAPGELVFGSIRFALGGHACNVSADLARLGFPKTRLRVLFPAGRDMFGRFLVESLRKQGLRPEAVLAARAPTSLDLILVARGQDRRYHADPGANVVMPADPVLSLLEKHRPVLYYAGGVGLLGPLDAELGAVLRKARDLRARTFVDVVSPYRKTWRFLLKALPYTDFFHCNWEEARALTGARSVGAALSKMRDLGARHVFLTMGGRGAVAAVAGGVIRLPAFGVEVVDPTGAGDAFSAGLILRIHDALVSGAAPEALGIEAWKDILLYASACGAACCTAIGTTTAVSRTAAAGLLQRQGRAIRDRIKVSPED